MSLLQIDTWNPELPFVHEGICFDPRNGSGATGNSININYMGFVVFLSPEKFLSLCLPLGAEKRSSATYFEKALPEGHCVSPPMLYLEKTGDGESEDTSGHWRVSGHEGRHRALACKRLGVGLIPVSCYPRNYRSRDVKKMIEAGDFRELENESRTRFVSFNTPFWIVNQDVYVANSMDEKLWVKPQEITTTAFKTSIFPDEPDRAHYYFSKRNNPGKRRKKLPRRRNFQVYSDGREYQVTVRAPVPHYDMDENTRYLQEVGGRIQECAEAASISELDLLESGGQLHDDGESVYYDFVSYFNNLGAARRFFRALKDMFSGAESIKVLMLEK